MGGISVCLYLRILQCSLGRLSCFQFLCCCILVLPCGLPVVEPIPHCLMVLGTDVLYVQVLVGGLKYGVGLVIGLGGNYPRLVIPWVCWIWVLICKLGCHG